MVVWKGEEKLYWYDSQPHPDEPSLAATHPHHKHVPPNIKQKNRIPAPSRAFTNPTCLR
ncbi:MAG: toxin-antitoxin system TumE family protein [Candidatus Electronema sp. VV]